MLLRFVFFELGEISLYLAWILLLWIGDGYFLYGLDVADFGMDVMHSAGIFLILGLSCNDLACILLIWGWVLLIRFVFY